MVLNRVQGVRRVLFILKCEFSEKDKNGSWESADQLIGIISDYSCPTWEEITKCLERDRRTAFQCSERRGKVFIDMNPQSNTHFQTIHQAHVSYFKSLSSSHTCTCFTYFFYFFLVCLTDPCLSCNVNMYLFKSEMNKLHNSCSFVPSHSCRMHVLNVL